MSFRSASWMAATSSRISSSVPFLASSELSTSTSPKSIKSGLKPLSHRFCTQEIQPSTINKTVVFASARSQRGVRHACWRVREADAGVRTLRHITVTRTMRVFLVWRRIWTCGFHAKQRSQPSTTELIWSDLAGKCAGRKGSRREGERGSEKR
eukprot:SAG11_NODE_491_length_8977_cov_7.387249_4_plen_153_part_00